MTIIHTTASLKADGSKDIGEVPIFAGNNETDATLALEDGNLVIRVPFVNRRSSSGKSTLLAGFSGTAKDFGEFGNVRLSGSVFVKDAPARKIAASAGVSAVADPTSRAAAIKDLANGMIASGMNAADAYKAAAGMV